MISYILLFLGSLCVSGQEYNIGNNTSIKFVNTYFSRNQGLMPGYQFESARDPQYILNQTINDTQLCMRQCAYNSVCHGVYEYTEDTNNDIYCNELSYLGHDPVSSNNYSNSYTKFQIHNNMILNLMLEYLN